MLVLSIRAIVMLVGLIVYALATNAKAARLGELSFFAGLLALLLGPIVLR